MEKFPKIRVIGNANEESKQLAKKEIEQKLLDQLGSLPETTKEDLKKVEYPKSKEEVAMINFANKETSNLMQEAGIEPYNVPIENYHIIPPELYKNKTRNKGTPIASSMNQGILFNAKNVRGNLIHFGTVAVHETLHLKAHLSIEVQEENDTVNKTPYRTGVSIQALQRHGYREKYHEHFAGLHEAIVAETEKKLLTKLLDQPELEKEKEWLNSIKGKELRKKLAEKKGIPENDIVWVDEKKENDYEIVSYRQQREVLNYLCAEIQKQFPDQYQSVDGVFKEFLKSHFTGQLLVIARLVEKTFGEGSFRLLGNMGTKNDSGVLHLESFKKARTRQKKERERFTA